ncbi:MAG: hypothetical protein KDC14_00630 [Planctomycetes bacterium]|nr:hypothetical protein [Planctomycetota bacterium]
MTNMRKKLAMATVGTAVSGVLALLVWAASGQGSADASHSPITPTMPNRHVTLGGDGRSMLLRKYPNGVACTVGVQTKERALGFRWSKGGDGSLVEEPGSVAWRQQPVWYWPNNAEWISDNVLLVTGVSPRNGRSIIETWSYEVPEGAPDVLPISQSNGQIDEVWLLPERDSVDLVFDSGEPDQQVITYAKENRGRPGHVFVRFASSGDVFDLDLSSGVLEAVASSTAGVAPFHVPELSNPGPWRVGGVAVDHQSEGFVYSLKTHMYDAPDSILILLLDSDRSGTIDSVVINDPTGHFHGNEVVDRF